ncbi:hypothetical protein KJ603_02190 [Patescibacteria group bacterium]|nr:hypothetical protein [Patescibacteria group bacterium]
MKIKRGRVWSVIGQLGLVFLLCWLLTVILFVFINIADNISILNASLIVLCFGFLALNCSTVIKTTALFEQTSIDIGILSFYTFFISTGSWTAHLIFFALLATEISFTKEKNKEIKPLC